jgi:GntR family transcriptional regulator
MLQIDKLSRIPIYEQVIAQVEKQIWAGVYKPEEPLPSVRTLSVLIGVNPNTLQKAYTELERRGMCVSVPGSGRFVARNAREQLLKRSGAKKEEFKSMALELLNAGFDKQALYAVVDEANAEKETGEIS